MCFCEICVYLADVLNELYNDYRSKCFVQVLIWNALLRYGRSIIHTESWPYFGCVEVHPKFGHGLINLAQRMFHAPSCRLRRLLLQLYSNKRT